MKSAHWYGRKSCSIAFFQVVKSPFSSLEKRGKRRFAAVAAWHLMGAVCLLATAACDRVDAADLIKVYAGYGGIAGYQMPLWVNKEAEIGKKYGIDIEPLLISGGALGMQALLANSIQISQNSASAAIGAALRGAPVALIATIENRMAAQVVSRPEIKTPQQLIGKDRKSVV